jgi:hypothetical protein
MKAENRRVIPPRIGRGEDIDGRKLASLYDTKKAVIYLRPKEALVSRISKYIHIFPLVASSLMSSTLVYKLQIYKKTCIADSGSSRGF